MKTPYLVVLAVLVPVLLVVGCSKVRQAGEAARLAQDARDGEYTVTTEEGETVKVQTKPGDDGSGTTTVTTDEGTTKSEWGAHAVKQEDVGIDFYPGATVEQGHTTSVAGGESEGSFSGVNLTTTDSFAAVSKFYKDRYAKGNTVTEQPDNLMIMINEGENSGKMIVVNSEDGKTNIMIMASGTP